MSHFRRTCHGFYDDSNIMIRFNDEGVHVFRRQNNAMAEIRLSRRPVLSMKPTCLWMCPSGGMERGPVKALFHQTRPLRGRQGLRNSWIPNSRVISVRTRPRPRATCIDTNGQCIWTSSILATPVQVSTVPNTIWSNTSVQSIAGILCCVNYVQSLSTVEKHWVSSKLVTMTSGTKHVNHVQKHSTVRHIITGTSIHMRTANRTHVSLAPEPFLTSNP